MVAWSSSRLDPTVINQVADVRVAAEEDRVLMAKTSAQLFGWAAAQSAAQKEVGGQLDAVAARERRWGVPPPPRPELPLLRFQEHGFHA